MKSSFSAFLLAVPSVLGNAPQLPRKLQLAGEWAITDLVIGPGPDSGSFTVTASHAANSDATPGFWVSGFEGFDDDTGDYVTGIEDGGDISRTCKSQGDDAQFLNDDKLDQYFSEAGLLTNSLDVGTPVAGGEGEESTWTFSLSLDTFDLDRVLFRDGDATKKPTLTFCVLFGLNPTAGTRSDTLVNFQELAIQFEFDLNGGFALGNAVSVQRATVSEDSGNSVSYGVTAQLCPGSGVLTSTAIAQGNIIPFCVCANDYPLTSVTGFNSLTFSDGSWDQVAIDPGTGVTVGSEDVGCNEGCCRVDTLPQLSLFRGQGPTTISARGRVTLSMGSNVASLVAVEGTYDGAGATAACAEFGANACCTGTNACVWPDPIPVTLYQGSCIGQNACEFNSSPTSLTVYEDSCTTASSDAFGCRFSGSGYGDVSIGPRSCRGRNPCRFGTGGVDPKHVVIGSDSCYGRLSCDTIDGGPITSFSVGDGSCLGRQACYNFPEGAMTVGDGECIGEGSCNGGNRRLQSSVTRTPQVKIPSHRDRVLQTVAGAGEDREFDMEILVVPNGESSGAGAVGAAWGAHAAVAGALLALLM